MQILDLDRLDARLHGELLRPNGPEYERARRVHNGAADRRPACIARCANPGDVGTCVDYARHCGLPVAVRGAGHSAGGWGTCDGGIVIDLSRMRRVEVNPHTRMARVEGGATWSDVDRATHPFGLAAPGATVSTTGVGGVTLGGGIGHLTRKHGLSLDNLIAADLVLADGRMVTASAECNPDLFWAIRGGGGNFGVAVSLVFRLHPVSMVIAGQTTWPADRGREVLAFYRDFMAATPNEMSGVFAFRVPDARSPVPGELHNRVVCEVTWCYTGPPQSFEGVFGDVRRIARPAFELIGAMPFPVLQTISDGLHRRGTRQHWRGAYFNDLTDGAIAALVENGSRLPSVHSYVMLLPVDGTAHAVAAEDTAFAYRDARWAAAIIGAELGAPSREHTAAWAGAFSTALNPHAAGGAYINFIGDEGDGAVRAAYRNNYPRLAAAKRKYDPLNLFSMNQNIRPAAAVAA